MHESPFHAFVVSEDLDFFLHDHPRREGEGFELAVTLPKPGLYRVLADFLPEAATPQLRRGRSSWQAIDARVAPLERDYAAETGSQPRGRTHTAAAVSPSRARRDACDSS